MQLFAEAFHCLSRCPGPNTFLRPSPKLRVPITFQRDTEELLLVSRGGQAPH